MAKRALHLLSVPLSPFLCPHISLLLEPQADCSTTPHAGFEAEFLNDLHVLSEDADLPTQLVVLSPTQGGPPLDPDGAVASLVANVGPTPTAWQHDLSSVLPAELLRAIMLLAVWDEPEDVWRDRDRMFGPTTQEEAEAVLSRLRLVCKRWHSVACENVFRSRFCPGDLHWEDAPSIQNYPADLAAFGLRWRAKGARLLPASPTEPSYLRYLDLRDLAVDVELRPIHSLFQGRLGLLTTLLITVPIGLPCSYALELFDPIGKNNALENLSLEIVGTTSATWGGERDLGRIVPRLRRLLLATLKVDVGALAKALPALTHLEVTRAELMVATGVDLAHPLRVHLPHLHTLVLGKRSSQPAWANGAVTFELPALKTLELHQPGFEGALFQLKPNVHALPIGSLRTLDLLASCLSAEDLERVVASSADRVETLILPSWDCPPSLLELILVHACPALTDLRVTLPWTPGEHASTLLSLLRRRAARRASDSHPKPLRSLGLMYSSRPRSWDDVTPSTEDQQARDDLEDMLEQFHVSFR